MDNDGGMDWNQDANAGGHGNVQSMPRQVPGESPMPEIPIPGNAQIPDAGVIVQPQPNVPGMTINMNPEQLYQYQQFLAFQANMATRARSNFQGADMQMFNDPLSGYAGTVNPTNKSVAVGPSNNLTGMYMNPILHATSTSALPNYQTLPVQPVQQVSSMGGMQYPQHMQIPEHHWQPVQNQNPVAWPPTFTVTSQTPVEAVNSTSFTTSNSSQPVFGAATVPSQVGSVATSVTSSILAPIASTIQNMLGTNKAVSPPGAAIRQNLKPD